MQEFGEIADLGAAAPQRRGKHVVLLLRAPDPGNGGRRAAWRYFVGLSAAAPDPDDAAGLCRAGRPRCPRPWVWLTVTPGSLTLPLERHITVSITTLTLCYATYVDCASAVDRRYQEQRPHRRAVIVGTYSPAPGQMGHDGQAPATERRKRRPRSARPGHGSAVTDGNLQQCPRRSPIRRARDRRAGDAHAGARCSAVHSSRGPRRGPLAHEFPRRAIRRSGGGVRPRHWRACRGAGPCSTSSPPSRAEPPPPARTPRSTRTWYDRKCPAEPGRKPRDADGVEMSRRNTR